MRVNYAEFVPPARAVVCTLLAAYLGGFVPRIRAQAGPPDAVYARPLLEASTSLESRLLKVVTYEDPVWQWAGDSDASGSDPSGPFGWGLKDRPFTPPAGPTPQGNATPDLISLQRLTSQGFALISLLDRG